MGEIRTPGYLTEDLTLRIVGGPPCYRGVTDKPIEYIAIADVSDRVVGFLYANDDDDAVGWQPKAAAGQAAHSAYFPWMMKLRECKARGLSPTEALRELMSETPDSPEELHSYVVPGTWHSAAGLAILKRLANTEG
ncbi:hypothetical protein [Kribbella ginsengisoli]|uniref:Uncharacterized protein n=1 Tax=Kribbella ginsengisoli TaxID=363865 RepID=A0ABP6Z7S6_9ACTN